MSVLQFAACFACGSCLFGCAFVGLIDKYETKNNYVCAGGTSILSVLVEFRAGIMCCLC
jgi:hypothetical protein